MLQRVCSSSSSVPSLCVKRTFSQLSNSRLKSIARRDRGLAEFNAYYTSIYTAQRWPLLLSALQQPTRFAALVNRYVDASSAPSSANGDASLAGRGGPSKKEPNLDCVRENLRKQGAIIYSQSNIECYIFPTTAAIPSSPSSSAAVASSPPRFAAPSSFRTSFSPLLPYYPLDLGSIFAVHALQPKPGDRVFDMCAAPGGKSLTIAQELALNQTDSTATLHVNDVSAARKQRLQQVLHDYLPLSVLQRIQISCLDLLKVTLPPAHYDAVLLDAPCSTDRHTLHSDDELAAWSSARFKRDAERQVSLLLQALRTVKVGGRIVYSTCSLSPTENDDVIDAVRAQCEKWKQRGKVGKDGMQVDFRVERIILDSSGRTLDLPDGTVTLPFGEETRHGWMILPDQIIGTNSMKEVTHGFGPLYICRLRRIAVHASDT